MATKTDIELKIVDSVDTSHTDAEVLADSASNPDAFYVGRGYLAHNGEKVIENIDEKGTYPNVTVGKATSADTANRANTAATASTAVNIFEAPVLAATEDEKITVKVGNKTSNALTVPYAQRADFATDLSGRVEATPEVFTYRPSAGDKSIKDDNAFIRRVKGNSVVFNQLVKDNGYTNNGVVTTFNNGVFTLAGTPTSTYFNTAAGIPLVLGHKVLLQMFVVANPNNINVGFRDLNQNNTVISTSTGGGVIYTASGQQLHFLGFYASNLQNIDFTGLQICQMIIDLTAMFGAGNEPTTVEEFRALYPNSYYPYNAGEIRNLNCYGIKTVGFNEFNGTYARVLPNESYYLSGSYTSIGFAKELGGATETISIPSNRIYTPTQLGYIYATGTDICINLHHTGYRDGEYEPYKEVTHALPLSQITNGEPLRKAGSVYDEINETEYIKRVGVVDLGSLNWESVYSSATGLTTFAAYIPTDCVSTYVTSDKANVFCTKYATDSWSNIWAGRVDKAIGIAKSYIRLGDSSFTTSTALKASLSGVLLHYELAEPIVTPIETPIDFNYYVEDFGTEEALLAEDSAPFSADIIYQFNATDQVRNNTRNIQRLQKTAFTPSGTTSQYIRGDGSYGDMVELSRVIPINNGEYEEPDAEDYYDRQFILTPNYYAKSPVELDNTATVAVYVTPTDSDKVLAEYWFEFVIGDTIPDITFFSSDENAVFRFSGEMMTEATNILHITSSDGGITFFGEIKNYII